EPPAGPSVHRVGRTCAERGHGVRDRSGRGLMDQPTRIRQPAESRPAMRNLIVVMMHLPRVTKSDLKVGMVILELTAGHGKLLDRTCRSEIARRAGVSEKTVTRALKKFGEAGIIEWSPAVGPGHLGTIRIRKAGEVMPDLPGL